MWKIFPHPVPCRIKNGPKVYPVALKFYQNPLFQENSKKLPPHDTLSHNFRINCNTLSHNYYQKRTPCRISFTLKGHRVEQLVPSSQIWETPHPGPNVHSLHFFRLCASQPQWREYDHCTCICKRSFFLRRI